MALWPFILYRHEKDRGDAKFINHEKIHLRQQIELLILPFYALYVFFYLRGTLSGKNHRTSYLAIPFEAEAYKNEGNPDYLKYRKWCAWVNYFS